MLVVGAVQRAGYDAGHSLAAGIAGGALPAFQSINCTRWTRRDATA